ncbi:MAG: hypothetical protein WCK33_02605 [Phycisphaerae bacterium]
MMLRSRLPHAFLFAAALLPAGCATNTWKDHFHAMSASSPTQGQATIERRTWEELAAFKPGPGERVVGESRFESAYVPEVKDLTALAKEVGATRVYWSSEFSRTAITEGSMSRPRDINSRGVTTIRGADGKEQRVTTDTTTTVWESVPYSRTDQMYRYLAIFTATGP